MIERHHGKVSLGALVLALAGVANAVVDYASDKSTKLAVAQAEESLRNQLRFESAEKSLASLAADVDAMGGTMRHMRDTVVTLRAVTKYLAKGQRSIAFDALDDEEGDILGLTTMANPRGSSGVGPIRAGAPLPAGAVQRMARDILLPPVGDAP